MTRQPLHQTQTSARHASWLLLAGAAMLLAGNLAHPVDADPSATSRLALASSALWVPVHLLLAGGFVALTGGLVALHRAITHPAGAAWSGLGAVTAVVGGTMLAGVFGALDGFAVAHLAPSFTAATGAERDLIASAAAALEAIDTGLAAIGTLAFLGLTLVAFGAAILASRVVARWLGWATLMLGVAGSVTGVLLTVAGATDLTINLLLRPLGVLTTVLFATLGVALHRGGPAAARDLPLPGHPALASREA